MRSVSEDEREREDEGEEEEVVVLRRVCGKGSRERERARDQASWDDVGRPAVYVCTSHRAGRGGVAADKDKQQDKIQQNIIRMNK